MNGKPLLLLGVTVLFVGGCTLAPKYTRPQAPIPFEWPSGPAYKEIQAAPVAPTATEISWRDFFVDERLQEVIGLALNNNRDLRTAALNVERARAFYGIQRAELLPTVDGVASGIRQRVPGDLSSNGVATTSEQFSVNLGITSWEIDFFGRIRSLKDRALEEYLSTEQARRSVQILLVSEVASAYLVLAADRESLKLTRYTLETQQDSYNLIRRRHEAGLAAELDLRQAQTRLDAARVDEALFTRLVAQAENALNLLVGSPVPGELLPDELNNISSCREIWPGLSSEVLLRRPDILQAEHLLRATNADIGAARAAFFPRISLTTAIGTASADLSGLFQAGSRTWNYAPQLVMPIFDARLWSALKASKAQREIALTQYEKAIQAAFREAADALAVRGTVEDQLSAQQSLVHASNETYRLSNARYTKGIDNFLGVLDAQRSLYTAELRLINIRLEKLSNQVRLYAALGGGGDATVSRDDQASK